VVFPYGISVRGGRVKSHAVSRIKDWRKMFEKGSRLKRPKYPMPGFVKQALEARGLMDEYRERPAYQQNDYIGWIDRAKLQATKEKRLHQMLAELEEGGVYMKMAHPSSKKNKKGVEKK
jgi:uncharacterized protein YdeI (YjbR/CyaY-like superfamily)